LICSKREDWELVDSIARLMRQFAASRMRQPDVPARDRQSGDEIERSGLMPIPDLK
jgi:hypothetical protein